MQIFGSTAIYAVNYDPSTRVLTIWFQHGAHGYNYYSVPLVIYDGLLAASSKGRYFNAYIRDQYRVAC